jgi:hypothetical protein
MSGSMRREIALEVVFSECEYAFNENSRHQVFKRSSLSHCKETAIDLKEQKSQFIASLQQVKMRSLAEKMLQKNWINAISTDLIEKRLTRSSILTVKNEIKIENPGATRKRKRPQTKKTDILDAKCLTSLETDPCDYSSRKMSSSLANALLPQASLTFTYWESCDDILDPQLDQGYCGEFRVLNYLLLDKIARPNSTFSVVLYIFNIEVYSSALYYL